MTSRTSGDIARSTTEANYLVLMLAGEAEWVQGDRTTLTAPGDIVVLDNARPAKAIMGPPSFDALVITIPKDDLDPACRDSDKLANHLLQRNSTPIRKCLNLVAGRMTAASPEELASLYGACVSLLPVEAGCFEPHKVECDVGKQHYLLRNIFDHIDQNIASGDLSPRSVAEKFGISVRYVHKLFITAGVTFCSYTTARRLEYIGRDLLSPACRQQAISVIAFRWGFNDLSSFNRAFRTRYGCTPSQFRMRAEG